MLGTILTHSTKSFLEDLGKDLVKKAAATVVTEIVRSRIDLWKQMKLKRMRRDLDVVWREEDRLYKERQEEQRKQREQREENASKQAPTKTPSPEDRPAPPKPTSPAKPPEANHPAPPPKEREEEEEAPQAGGEEAGGDTDGTLDAQCAMS